MLEHYRHDPSRDGSPGTIVHTEDVAGRGPRSLRSMIRQTHQKGYSCKPSTSAASCDAVSRITPSLIGGHRKAPCSSRFHNSTRPDPSQATIFILAESLT